MKKIENGSIEVILIEEFDFNGYVEKGDVVEKVGEFAVDKSHGIFLGGDDGFVAGFDVSEAFEYQFAVQECEFVMVGEFEMWYCAMTF